MSEVAWAVSCRVLDGCDHEFEVAVVQAGDGLAEAGGDSAGDAGGELEDASFAAG